LPDATPTSTAPPSPARRNNAWFAAQIAVTAIILWFVGGRLVDQWKQFRGTPIEVHPRWSLIALSCVVVLAAYAVLIETWRRILRAWGDHLGFVEAARIYFVSNLGRYIPGKIWSIGVMAEMSRRRQVSVAAATGSSIISTLVNIATGFVIALITGWKAVDRVSGGHAVFGIVIAVLVLLGLFTLPVVLPALESFVRRRTGRELSIGNLPHRAIYIAIVGNLVAWVLYGTAFQAFTAGVIEHASGSPIDYIATYASSYVLGYLALAIPGGLFARELALTGMLQTLQLVQNVKEAAVVAVTSRLWLTVLEILPALLFLALGARRRTHAMTARDGTKT
jgi:glycosyltransferase 2 family protein